MVKTSDRYIILTAADVVAFFSVPSVHRVLASFLVSFSSLRHLLPLKRFREGVTYLQVHRPFPVLRFLRLIKRLAEFSPPPAIIHPPPFHFHPTPRKNLFRRKFFSNGNDTRWFYASTTKKMSRKTFFHFLLSLPPSSCHTLYIPHPPFSSELNGT